MGRQQEQHKQKETRQAATVFEDGNALLINDPEHSEDEDRFILLGLSANLRLLVVCHCMRCTDTVIRIISARKATTRETKQYNEFSGGGRMLEEYDFSKAVRNPYVADQPEQVTIQVSAETAEYFRTLSQQTGVPYQTLMKLYLKDCAEQKRRLTFA